MDAEATVVGGDANVIAPPLSRDRIAEVVQHSEAVVQILGVPPHWLARWGSLTMLGVLALLLSLGWLIHYPDVVSASVTIGTELPPATVVAQTDGHLERLTVHDGDRVTAGDLLARIATSANPQAISRLEALLANWDDNHLPSESAISELASLPLGELHTDYATFARAYAVYTWHLTNQPAAQVLSTLTAQRQPLQDRIDSLERQRALLVNEKDIAERSYQRSAQLARNQDASILTVEDRQRAVLLAHRMLESMTADVANVRLELAHVDFAIADTLRRDREQRQELQVGLREAVKTLSGKLALWERTYVLRAPITGTVSLSRFSTDSQFVRAGEEIMAVVPAGEHDLVGRVLLPISRAGSVRVGQTVFVRLDNYPAERFGLLRGRIDAISPVPLAAHYAVTMSLPEGLVTTFGQRLTQQQEMQGKAEIVVEDLRVIDRIFYQFRRAFFRSD